MYIHKQQTYEEEKDKQNANTIDTDIKSLDELPHLK